jgi:hypothetical protein
MTRQSKKKHKTIKNAFLGGVPVYKNECLKCDNCGRKDSEVNIETINLCDICKEWLK